MARRDLQDLRAAINHHMHEGLHDRSSRPGESHPQALTEPDVSVSAHPALIVQPRHHAAPASGQRESGPARKSCGSTAPPAADVA
jgi:hypothetical protein